MCAVFARQRRQPLVQTGHVRTSTFVVIVELKRCLPSHVYVYIHDLLMYMCLCTVGLSQIYMHMCMYT